jgi:hypothetical protein
MSAKVARRPTATYEPIRPPRGAEPTCTASLNGVSGGPGISQSINSAFDIYRLGGTGASGAGSAVFGSLGVFGVGTGVASGVFLPGRRLFLPGAFGSVGLGVLLFGPVGPEVPGSGVLG